MVMGSLVSRIFAVISLTAPFCLFHQAYAQAEQPKQSTAFPLWDVMKSFPASRDLPQIENVEFRLIKAYEPQVDGYRWLHGLALAVHNGKLFASFGHNRGSENTNTEEARFRVSHDLGKIWSETRTIDSADETFAVSHGVFLSHHGDLWAFQGAFHGRLVDVHTRGYRYDNASGTWSKLGIVAEEGFFPMQEPFRLANGNWLMAGLRVENALSQNDDNAAVAISQGDDFSQWKVMVIPKVDSLDLWGESTVLPSKKNELLNISRFRKPVALASVSRDAGNTWTKQEITNLPMTASKPYSGRLPDGTGYLIGTTTSDSGNRRSPLTIALTSPDGMKFNRVLKIRDAIIHEPAVESDPNAKLSYPYSIVVGDKLLVAYSNDGGRGKNLNSAELAIIPLNSLALARSK